MKTSRRQAVLSAASVLSGALLALPSRAAEWPGEKPIRIIVTFPPGGNADVLARLYGSRLSKNLGQAVIVENRAGAGGAIGMASAAREPADGYSFLLGDIGTQVTTPIAMKKVGYDPQRDFVSVSRLTSVSLLLLTHPKSGIRSVKELLDKAKANPGKVTCASAGGGAPSRISMELFQAAAGIELLHVPYKGSGPAIVDLIGGQVDCMFDGGAANMVRGGKLLALAATGGRSAAFPEVSTIGESGVPSFQFTSWHGVFAPKGTPAAVLTRVAAELKRIAVDPEIVATLRELGIDQNMSDGPTFDQFIASQRTAIERVVQERKIVFE